MAFVVVDPQSVATMTLIREGSGGVFVAGGAMPVIPPGGYRAHLP
jgi:hypothetical protein